MGTGRLEAFSDGVIAIIITIMVLELKVPRGAELSDLTPMYPVFISYVLSFINIGIYWNNHHHMLGIAENVNGKVLWANIHLLFWLSLVPFVTSWMGENHFQKWPVAIYGVVLFMCGMGYYFLSQSLLRIHAKDSNIYGAKGNDRKGKISIIIYAMGVTLSFIHPWLGLLMYVIVAAIWFIPDPRIETVLVEEIKEEETIPKKNE